MSAGLAELCAEKDYFTFRRGELVEALENMMTSFAKATLLPTWVCDDAMAIRSKASYVGLSLVSCPTKASAKGPNVSCYRPVSVTQIYSQLSKAAT